MKHHIVLIGTVITSLCIVIVTTLFFYRSNRTIWDSQIVTKHLIKQSVYARYGKRVLDIILSVTGLIILAPVMLIIGIIVRFNLGKPIIFKQQRPGLHGKPFTIYKFRTMTEQHDAHRKLSPDTLRLTPFGRVLRSTSLDELPELFNVLKGDMSIVGPRPLLMDYLPHYTPYQHGRHDILPGITGWAQINGRNLLTWNERFEHDVWYVENLSLWLDIKIIIMTVFKVIQKEGITDESGVTMQRFVEDS
ncbi:MAG: sugar transferase [Chloroflexota bacterium]